MVWAQHYPPTRTAAAGGRSRCSHRRRLQASKLSTIVLAGTSSTPKEGSQSKPTLPPPQCLSNRSPVLLPLTDTDTGDMSMSCKRTYDIPVGTHRRRSAVSKPVTEARQCQRREQSGRHYSIDCCRCWSALGPNPPAPRSSSIGPPAAGRRRGQCLTKLLGGGGATGRRARKGER